MSTASSCRRFLHHLNIVLLFPSAPVSADVLMTCTGVFVVLLVTSYYHHPSPYSFLYHVARSFFVFGASERRGGSRTKFNILLEYAFPLERLAIWWTPSPYLFSDMEVRIPHLTLDYRIHAAWLRCAFLSELYATFRYLLPCIAFPPATVSAVVFTRARRAVLTHDPPSSVSSLLGRGSGPCSTPHYSFIRGYIQSGFVVHVSTNCTLHLGQWNLVLRYAEFSLFSHWCFLFFSAHFRPFSEFSFFQHHEKSSLLTNLRHVGTPFSSPINLLS